MAIAAGVALAAWGMLEKMAYENCLEMARASDRGGSAIVPQCQSDQSGKFFLLALPAAAAGVIALVMRIRGVALFSSLTR